MTILDVIFGAQVTTSELHFGMRVDVMRDMRCINVAFTRAMRGLVVIGDM